MNKKYQYQKAVNVKGQEVKVFINNDGEKVIIKNKVQYKQIWDPRTKSIKNVL